MVDHTAQTLRAEIDHLRQLARGVSDDRVHAAIDEMIEELERRLSELEGRHPEL
jgi:ribosome-associated translation inhibitor RaiA